MAATHHIYRINERNDGKPERIERCGQVPNTVRIDANGRVDHDASRLALLEAVGHFPGDYLIVCEQSDRVDPMPAFLYRMIVRQPEPVKPPLEVEVASQFSRLSGGDE